MTVVFEMPNTKPTTTSAEALADKVARGRNRMFCDFAFYVGGTRENVESIGAWKSWKARPGSRCLPDHRRVTSWLMMMAGWTQIISRLSRRAAFHSEDEFRLRERVGHQVAGDAASHPVWRDVEAAVMCTTRLLRIARKHGKRIHILHISTAEELPLLAAHRDVATVEVTPHHLTLSADDYARLGTKLQMNPPVRDKRHRDGLWSAINSGLVDVLGRIMPPTHWKKRPSPIRNHPRA